MLPSENLTAQEVIDKLKLAPLPEEGGFYREVYRDPLKLSEDTLPEHRGNRHASTAIYYLVTPEEFSALHAVKSTEVFHFYAGDPVEMLQITPEGEAKSYILGTDWSSGQASLLPVDPYVWQGTRLIEGGKWALMGCTVAPGFEFEDFIIEDRSQLIQRFPQHQRSILRFTR